ncbi:MAG: hypothetical protein AAF572_07465 [Cyanobacteria bacterium P01_B01_bin.77]
MTRSPAYFSPSGPTVPNSPTMPNGPISPQQPTNVRSQSLQPLAWLCGLALAALALVPQEQLTRFSGGLVGQPQSLQSWAINQDTSPVCQAVLNADQRLSRDQLTQFLSLPQSASPATVHETIAPPHCLLSKPHQAKRREVYPLAFDPKTWFVVNYEQGSYTGYDFVFQH